MSFLTKYLSFATSFIFIILYNEKTLIGDYHDFTYIILFINFIINNFIIKDKNKTKSAIISAVKSFENILPQFLFIIVTIGIILAFINPNTISKIIGSNSGFIGVILSAILGSITMMPTFVAFSLGNTLLLNGAGYSQVGTLVSTLVLVGMMTYTLESQYIGKRAAFLRNFIGFLFSILAGILLGRIMVILWIY